MTALIKHGMLLQPCDVMSHVMSDHIDWRSVRRM